MDPISQGALGGALSQSIANKENIARITLIGCLAGMAPDLDVLIQSTTDPILFLEYHRQFTHSLIFIPVGSLIVAGALYPIMQNALNFKTVYLASALGYLTHGLLDACTSYGTLLFWPFSDRYGYTQVGLGDFKIQLSEIRPWLEEPLQFERQLYETLSSKEQPLEELDQYKALHNYMIVCWNILNEEHTYNGIMQPYNIRTNG